MVDQQVSISIPIEPLAAARQRRNHHLLELRAVGSAVNADRRVAILRCDLRNLVAGWREGQSRRHVAVVLPFAAPLTGGDLQPAKHFLLTVTEDGVTAAWTEA